MILLRRTTVDGGSTIATFEEEPTHEELYEHLIQYHDDEDHTAECVDELLKWDEVGMDDSCSTVYELEHV